MSKFTIPRPFDMHVHFRRDQMMQLVVPYTARQFQAALVMPNTKPPILTANDLAYYRQEVIVAAGSRSDFRPLMTFEVRPETSPDIIPGLAKAGAIAGKIYPKGMTTNAEHGVSDYFALVDILQAMSDQGLVLCLHGEQPGNEWKGKNRERAFLRETLPYLVAMFPKLRIVLEHITTRAAVEAVLALPETVAATITVHHLVLTRNEVAGDTMNPNHWCKPVAKKESDRKALVRAAISGCQKFFFGSDSAPHLREGKERLYDCCAGIFTAPVALPLLAKVFAENNALKRLQVFTHDSAKEFYQLDGSAHRLPRLKLVPEPMTVPKDIGGVVPFMPGQVIPWSVVE